MKYREFGSTGVSVSEIGLGGSRLGSILGASSTGAADLLARALDMGVTFFDTSDLYGQGDSERLIGRHVAGRPGVVVATKVGKRHPLKYRLLAPLKAPLVRLLKRSAAGMVKGARAKPVPTCFAPSYLTGAIDRSLRRLGTDRLDVLMLHSPAAEILARGDAVATLEAARIAGKVGIVGVSIDDVAAGHAALADPRVQALQIPLRFGETAFHALAAEAGAKGVAVVAREIFGGAGGAPRDRAAIEAALHSAVALPGVAVALVGTTRSEHLREAVEYLAP